mgnify:CR=1 FL=1
MSHLVIMAAGTGGHIVPGLAVAREMQARGWSVSWLGTEAGMENKLVPPTGLPLDRIGFSGLRGKGLLHTLTGGVRLLKAFWDCLLILRRRSADAVLGMGGYVCFPGGVMASLLGKPLLLVNADAALLLSNLKDDHAAIDIEALFRRETLAERLARPEMVPCEEACAPASASTTLGP